jgi:hypothetical protein
MKAATLGTLGPGETLVIAGGQSRIISADGMSIRPFPDDTDLWREAAEQVSAAMIGFRNAQEANGGTPIDREEMLQIERTTRSYVFAAKQAYDSDHPGEHEPGCRCRHESIVIVASSIESRMRGVCFQDLARRSLAALEAYFETVS